MTLSTDTPEEIAKGRAKHGLQAIMLSDRELEVTDLFGLRNLGIHSGPPAGISAPALPVPTSLLVDAAGIEFLAVLHVERVGAACRRFPQQLGATDRYYGSTSIKTTSAAPTRTSYSAP